MEGLYNNQYAAAQNRKVPNSIKRLISQYLPIVVTDSMLEIGVGNGDLLPFLYANTPNVYGIDINKWSVEKIDNKDIIHASATDLPFDDATFNRTLSVHTLEHIEDLYLVFKEIDRVTKNNGMSIHFFPANLITKAESAFFDALRIHPLNVRKAWQKAHELHIHDLNPDKVNHFILGTKLKLVFAKKVFIPERLNFNWAILLKKSV